MHLPSAADRRLLGLSIALIVFWGAGRQFPAQAQSPTLAACAELVQNGSFEAGAQGWQQYSAQGYDLISDFNPHTGNLGAYLAGVNSADDRISQPIALPAGASSTILTGWWFLATAESAGAFDTMTVSLLRTNGTLLTDLLTVDNHATVGLWDQIALDLTAYAGQTVVIQFAARTDANNISDFYLDDVSVLACAAVSTPTATATTAPSSTPTVIGTATPSSTVTVAATATASATATPSATVTATSTASTAVTPTATITATRAATQTATVTPIPTVTPTATPFKVFARCFLPYLSTGGSQ